MNKGYITLMSVLVVGVVGVAIALSLILLGIAASRTGFAIEQSYQAKALAHACAEEALQQIRNSVSYTGSGNVVLGQGSCSYTVTSQGGENRIVVTTATVDSMVRKVEIIIDAIQPTIQIVSWQEVA